MKLLVLKVFVFFIKVLYAPMKLRKTQNKILWLSRQSNDKSADMIMLESAIENLSPRTGQVFRLRKLKDEASVSLSYVLGIIGDMWHIASARVVITDTYSIPVSCLDHKKDTRIVQLWHALGAVKKFGLQSVGKAQGRAADVAEVLCMHRNYDFVFAPSEATGDIYCKAFGCNPECIKVLALPRVDTLLSDGNRRQEFLDLNPHYNGKTIVAYIPTFRNNDHTYAQRIHKAFEDYEDLALVISAHPLSATASNGDYAFNGEFSSCDLMKLCDVIITDYSACAFEGALLRKPMFFYVPDYEVYKREQGLNVDVMSELNGFTFTDENQLVEAVRSNDVNLNILEEFRKQYVETQSTDNTERMAQFICSLLKE